MTVRNNKRLLLVALALVLIAGALNLWHAFGPHGEGWKDLTDVLPFGFFAILLWTMWARLSKLEAEHGPDYAPPASPYARTILIIAAGVAAVLAALAAYLLLRKA